MDVSIVIVSYNTCGILDECLASIKQETSCSHEIIVVDNASADNSRKMLRENHPDVTLIENSENAGFARANNQGFAVARGKYFFMLNSDTVVLDGAIDKLLAFVKSNPDIGICGPRNIGRDGKTQYNCDHFPGLWNTFCYYTGLASLFPKSSLFNRCWIRYWDYSDIRDVERITGCSLLIRSDLYRELNGLDENFFMYFEETDFCLRAHNKGSRTTYFPGAVIMHYGGESSEGAAKDLLISKTVADHYFKSRYYYFRKYHGLFITFLIRLLDLMHGIYLLLRNSIRRDADKRKRNIMYGKFIIRTALAG